MLCCSWANASISVEVKDEQPNNGSLLGLRLRVISDENLNYDNALIKLYLKKSKEERYVLERYYTSGFSANLEEVDSGNVALVVSAPKLLRGMNPEENGISLGIHRPNWEPLNKSSLSGFPQGEKFSEAKSYAVYHNGSQIAGNVEKDDVKLRFVGIRPETGDSSSPWVQIQNYGSNQVSLSGISIKDKSGQSYSLGNSNIKAQSTLRICSGSISACAIDSSVIQFSKLSFGNVGEFVLYQDSTPIDYIVWGGRGNFADTLLIEGKYINPDEYFNTDDSPVIGPVSRYRKGDFYRAFIPNGSDSIDCWNKYRGNMVGSPFSQKPLAESFSRPDSSSVYKHTGEETVFAWIPVEGAETYELIVVNAKDSSLVYQGVSDITSTSLVLGEGEYLWMVNPHSGAEENPYVAFIPWDYTTYGLSYDRLNVYEFDGTEILLYDLGVEPLAARKDSYLLDLKWGEHIIEADWDKPHNSSGYVDQYGNRRFRDFNHKHYDIEESWRCWAVASTMINHYYGGTLTQDEIKYHAMESLPNRYLDAFPHSDSGGGSFGNLVLWILGDIDVKYIHYSQTVPSVEDILQSLQNGPVIIQEERHEMVIDAAIQKGDEVKFRYLNTDNDGTVEWRGISPETVYYTYIDDPRNYGYTPRKSELYEDLNHNGIMDLNEIFDEDNDGLLDFDEKRFGTYLKNPNGDGDADGDGIPDKIEIMSYTIREPYPGVYGVVNEVYADYDGDGLRAELDPNSDDDGLDDGEEDVNANGLKDKGERDVYFEDDDKVVVTSNISNIMLYALSQLSYNDGVECYNNRLESGFCSIASASKVGSGEYSVLVGARAHVGNVVSRGNVLFRSNAHVYENVVLTENSSISDIYMQNGTSIDGTIERLPYGTWDVNFYPQNYELDEFLFSNALPLVVGDGQWGLLSSEYPYSFVKVEAGGTLIIPPGVVYIQSIQLDSRSRVKFTNPGSKTVLHINGDFTWRATMLHDESQYPFIARGFKLEQHKKDGKRMFIDNLPVGQIVAPYSDVVMAQSNKKFYGTVFAKNIVVHQYAKLYHVDFSPVEHELAVNMGGL